MRRVVGTLGVRGALEVGAVLALGAALAGCGASTHRAAVERAAVERTAVERTAVERTAVERPARTYTYTATITGVERPAPSGHHAPASHRPAAAPAGHHARPATAHTAHPPAPPSPGHPLAGKVVGIDPGHNGENYTDPTFIDHLIWNGREQETCDTTGTETDGGYTEARFNWNVAGYLTRDLRREGAKVVLTRHSNDGVGPCVTTRAEIIDHAHANVAVDIHADGGPASGRGFAILEPVADGPNDHVIAASKRFGHDLLETFRAQTGMPVSTYDGVGGIALRDNLAGLNLTTVPKVLIECGNMRNATDAALLVTPSFQARAASAMARAITDFLTQSSSHRR